MFTVLYGHAHSDWQRTEAFLYVIGKKNIMLTWKYTIVLNTKGNDNFKHFLLYTYCRNSYTKGKALMACTELSLKQKGGDTCERQIVCPIRVSK